MTIFPHKCLRGSPWNLKSVLARQIKKAEYPDAPISWFLHAYHPASSDMCWKFICAITAIGCAIPQAIAVIAHGPRLTTQPKLFSAYVPLDGILHLRSLFLKILCIFSENKPTLGQSIQWIWLEMLQGTHKSQFYFSRNHGCEVTITSKQCVKINIFRVLTHKSITTWISEIAVQ